MYMWVMMKAGLCVHVGDGVDNARIEESVVKERGEEGRGRGGGGEGRGRGGEGEGRGRGRERGGRGRGEGEGEGEGEGRGRGVYNNSQGHQSPRQAPEAEQLQAHQLG